MTITDLLYGPMPPDEGEYEPRPTFHCRIGLHRVVETWEFTIVNSYERWNDEIMEMEQVQELAVNLDRECDYRACARCRKMIG